LKKSASRIEDLEKKLNSLGVGMDMNSSSSTAVTTSTGSKKQNDVLDSSLTSGAGPK
jgi:hypothetical protein